MLLDQQRLDAAIADLWRESAAIAEEMLAPQDRPSLCEFAERDYELPSDSAVRGLFRFAQLPYLRRPLECLEDPRVRQVVVAKGSQLAFTTLAQIWMAWTMAYNRASMISVWPSEGLLKRYVLTRVNTMIEDCAPLRRIFSRSGLRDSDDSQKHKGFPGGSIDFITGGSSSQLKSITAKRMHVSELDELQSDLQGQGDPLDQARRALRTHWDSKEYLECTPTLAGHSRVWRELELSSWNEYHVPCPYCNAPQVLRWREGMEHGDSKGAGKYHFVYELDSAGRIVPGSTQYVCIKCDKRIEHVWKKAMEKDGEWIARYPDRVAFQGFHLSALYALTGDYNWDACAQIFAGGIKKKETRKVFVNTILGLPFDDEEDSSDPKGLQARAEFYDAQVPQGVVIIVVSVDVQGDRLEYLVLGIGAKMESWVIEWERVEGDPGKKSTWDKLADVLNGDWVDADGVVYGPAAIAIDAGFMSTKVKLFCAGFTTKDGVRPIHVIGRDGRARPLMEKPGQDVKKRRRSKRPSWILGTDTMNDLVAARLRIVEPGPEYIHTPSNEGRLDSAFYAQVTSEQLKTVYVRGLPVRKWVLPENTRNEALDLLRMCFGALESLGTRVTQQLMAMSTQKRGQMRDTRAPSTTAPVATVDATAEPAPPPPVRLVPAARRRARTGVVSEAID